MDEKKVSQEEMESIGMQKTLHEDTIAHMKDVVDHQLDDISERKLLLKTDLHVVPILFVLFLCAFIDR
jgi:hypothetical protein